MDLSELVVLFLDCQTTGANPKSARVLEIGWARSDILEQSGNASAINVCLVKHCSEINIPKHVQKITGITMEDLSAGSELGHVWSSVLNTALAVARVNKMQRCPTVIHYAKFEIPFLVDMHAISGTKTDFPLSFICTHRISTRVFPDLPRRSIRAMAGYFGYSIPTVRRSKEHVHATALIWRELVRLLKTEHDITTPERLLQWLGQSRRVRSSSRIYPMSERALNDLPQKPGVYRMLRSNNDVIYVGKAVSLRQRVKSYFTKSSRHPEHILEMLSQAARLDLTTTESSVDAAIFESDEIKRLGPPYNVALHERGRDVWFCTKDYCQFSPVPTRKHAIGPVVDRGVLMQFAALKNIVGNTGVSKSSDHLLLGSLGVPEENIPDIKCVRDGYEIFVDRHAKVMRAKIAGCAFYELARRLWLERKKDKEVEIDENEDFVLKGVAASGWTGRSVCHWLESTVMRAGHMIRRARWFVLLSEASIRWEESVGSAPCDFLIVFEKGQVLYRRTNSRDEIPVPPGHKRGFLERQRSFDLMTFDRMRVVTTEIRKLLNENRRVEVRLSPANSLDRRDLVSILRWV
jgi:DNA polymerase-3 subunit epsilon